MKTLWKKLKELPLATHYRIHLILLVSGLIPGAIFSRSNLHGIATVAFFVMLAGLLWRPVFLCCPHCGGAMPPRSGLPRFCPHCGKKLQ